MAKIEFNQQQKQDVIQKIQRYFSRELDSDLGQFEADFLLDFISQELGHLYYNQGLYDAQAALTERVESISDAIYQLEKY